MNYGRRPGSRVSFSGIWPPSGRRAVTRGGGQVPEGVFAELRKHFSEREIVELAVAAAAENFFSRLHGALGIEAQGFCAVPLGGPLAAGDGAGRE